MQTESAHARSTDPQTSHEAARVVTPGLPTLQALVEAFAIDRGPDGFLDVDLVAAFPDLGPSTLRTRRAELGARNIILDSGLRRHPDGSKAAHTVWIHRSFVSGAPEIRDPPEPASEKDRAAAMDMAAQLEAAGRQMRSEGRSMFAGHLDEAARLMRLLAA